MNQEEIEARNTEIALMLGYEFDTEAQAWYPNKKDHEWGKKTHELSFHSDFNQLAIALDFIELLGFAYDMYSSISDDDHYECNFWNKRDPEIEGRSKTSLKEAIFIGVSDFAKKHNGKNGES
jgi:hypothetical protein